MGSGSKLIDQKGNTGVEWEYNKGGFDLIWLRGRKDQSHANP